MLKLKKYDDDYKILTADDIVKLLEQNRNNIKSKKSSDEEFIK